MKTIYDGLHEIDGQAEATTAPPKWYILKVECMLPTRVGATQSEQKPSATNEHLLPPP